jgi:glycosyltransferase involved in cell wall biosynthesis
MRRLTVRGKYIYEGDQKFFARGVSYGPFAPNSRGERYPEPERTDTDFALMRELGANLVRTYVPPPPWMFELAAKHELRLMVGMPWPFHMAFLDSPEMMRDIRKTITDGVTSMRQFAEVIFAYSLGNEIRSDIVRWHGPRAISKFLRKLYDLGKQLDPEGLFTYSNYPSAEYLELNFLDLVSFNVYLHREADFRRYLTHLLASTSDRPLILSETGMDTIREGEAHQAALLAWQSRAAFELGLAGFIVFAFTDEWHTGGAEITDWAFGLVTRERQSKRAFDAIGATFKQPLPPPLANPPAASVVVCAHNAAAVLARCLESLKRLNYPEYEVIVVDDGSTDTTGEIARNAGVRLVTIEHQGLSAARNAGIVAAQNLLVAFIDADAEADHDWLYHLVETITRARTAAVGGRNCPPASPGAFETALASAPGAPREVRASDDQLDQVCGCSMALDRSKLPSAPFDPAFTIAGDDVDFSWSLRERGFKLAYAPAAVVLHHPRPTVSAYLRQQAGYGRAEAMLARKYPERSSARIYGENGWLARWFGAGPRVYYGLFGRGLFQSLYRDDALPLLTQLPLSTGWLLASFVLLFFGLVAGIALSAIGATGIFLTLLASVGLAVKSRRYPRLDARSRFYLMILCLLGPVVRNFARTSKSQVSIARNLSPLERRRGRFQANGRIVLPLEAKPSDENGIDALIDRARLILFRCGARVARSDGYQPYDLRVETDWGACATLNFLSTRDDPFTLGWKLRFTSREFLRLVALAALVIIATVTALASSPSPGAWWAAVLALGWVVIAIGAAAWMRDVRLLGPLIQIAVHDAITQRAQAVAPKQVSV